MVHFNGIMIFIKNSKVTKLITQIVFTKHIIQGGVNPNSFINIYQQNYK